MMAQFVQSAMRLKRSGRRPGQGTAGGEHQGLFTAVVAAIFDSLSLSLSYSDRAAHSPSLSLDYYLHAGA